ncbi:MAG: hypothetical protein R3C05_10365 [Pirellulaceae bacterium]
MEQSTSPAYNCHGYRVIHRGRGLSHHFHYRGFMSPGQPIDELDVTTCRHVVAASDDDLTAVNVVTGSRLHFGLLTIRPVGGMNFGGCGLMLRRPSIHVRVEPADRLTISGPFAERCDEVINRLVTHFRLGAPPTCRLDLNTATDAHFGLGSGTQVNLAVATGLVRFLKLSTSDEFLAAKIAARGKRSAIGVHGFARGGFIAEAGVPEGQALGKLTAREPFPSEWSVMLVRPESFHTHVYGSAERKHFAELRATSAAEYERLLNTIDREIVPAVRRHDFDSFCESIADYNYRSGLLFASVQGGAYNGPELQSLVDFMRDQGCRGVGQSSWGPTIFAFFQNEDAAREMRLRLRQNCTHESLAIEITSARNKPASVCVGRQ